MHRERVRYKGIIPHARNLTFDNYVLPVKLNAKMALEYADSVIEVYGVIRCMGSNLDI